MNGLIKKYWYLLVLLFVLPIGLNFLLQANAPFSVIGDPSVWLTFWGTYSASIIGSLITLFVLYKTLKQNEANNEESKSLQIAIFKKGLEERRILELSVILKNCLHYIDYPKLSRNCNALKSKEFSETRSFFDSEIVRSLNTLSSLSLDFITSDKDDKENEFKTLFRNILDEYIKLISMAIRIFSIIETLGFENKMGVFKIKYEKDLKGVSLFTKEEYNIVVQSTNGGYFNAKLMEFLDVRINRFNDEYSVSHQRLINMSKELISYKKEQLEKVTT